MAGIYILAAVIIVLLHIRTLPLVFVRIFREAFSANPFSAVFLVRQ